MHFPEELRMKLCVDTVRFILFLYIQSTPRLSLKSSLLTGEEYPSIIVVIMWVPYLVQPLL